MVDTLALKAQIIKKGMQQQEVRSLMGMTKRKWYKRMNERNFDAIEMSQLCKILDIEDPVTIFFAD